MSDFNISGLDWFIAGLKGKLPVVRVGILNDSPRGSGKEPTNATVGIAHEFGTSKLPQRSFLRMPISERLMKELESKKAFDKNVLAQVVKNKTIEPWMKKVAVAAEAVVAEAFDTGGFGKWKPSNMSRKKVHQTLVETQQLRNSISSVVK